MSICIISVKKIILLDSNVVICDCAASAIYFIIMFWITYLMLLWISLVFGWFQHDSVTSCSHIFSYCGHHQHTVQCRYNAVNFLENINKRHPMARPLGRGMGCLLWIQHVIDILPQFQQLLMKYLTILDHVLSALDCISFWSIVAMGDRATFGVSAQFNPRDICDLRNMHMGHYDETYYVNPVGYWWYITWAYCILHITLVCQPLGTMCLWRYSMINKIWCHNLYIYFYTYIFCTEDAWLSDHPQYTVTRLSCPCKLDFVHIALRWGSPDMCQPIRWLQMSR